VRRVLLDENLPRRLRRDLPGHEVRTVAEEGWRGIENGDLIRRASSTFDVLLTGDQNLVHQQSIAEIALGVVVIETYSLRVGVLGQFATEISEAIDDVEPGEIRIVRVSRGDGPASGDTNANESG